MKTRNRRDFLFWAAVLFQSSLTVALGQIPTGSVRGTVLDETSASNSRGDSHSCQQGDGLAEIRAVRVRWRFPGRCAPAWRLRGQSRGEGVSNSGRGGDDSHRRHDEGRTSTADRYPPTSRRSHRPDPAARLRGARSERRSLTVPDRKPATEWQRVPPIGGSSSRAWPLLPAPGSSPEDSMFRS